MFVDVVYRVSTPKFTACSARFTDPLSLLLRMGLSQQSSKATDIYCRSQWKTDRMITLGLLVTITFHALALGSANAVCHSEAFISLKKMEDYIERNHVWAIHRSRRSREGRQVSLLQLGRRSLTRFAGIRLHDQVVASKKLGRKMAILYFLRTRWLISKSSDLFCRDWNRH